MIVTTGLYLNHFFLRVVMKRPTGYYLRVPRKGEVNMAYFVISKVLMHNTQVRCAVCSEIRDLFDLLCVKNYDLLNYYSPRHLQGKFLSNLLTYN